MRCCSDTVGKKLTEIERRMTIKHPDTSAFQHPDIIVNNKFLGGFAGRNINSLRFVFVLLVHDRVYLIKRITLNRLTKYTR